MHYNVEHSVINYDNQSKDLAITKYNLDDREELAQRTYKSAVALRRMLEDKMDIRAKIIRDNTKLLKELEKVTELNQNILEQEIFSTDTELKDNEQLRQNRTDLRNSENRISQISDNLNEYNFTKEGVGIDNMVTEWLMACINEAKTKAELKVLHERRNDILNQYREFAPVGTQVKRKERAIGIAEDTYREQLRGLSEARLRLQNIKMTTANLQIIAPPEFPLTDNGRKRLLYVVAALIGSLIFITFYFLIIELTDRTLRDAERSHRLSGLPVIAAFNGISNLVTRDLYQMPLMRHWQTSAAHDPRLFVIHRHNAAVAQCQQFFRQPRITTKLLGHQIQFNAVKPRRLNQPLTVFQYLIHVDHPAVRGDLALLPQA